MLFTQSLPVLRSLRGGANPNSNARALRGAFLALLMLAAPAAADTLLVPQQFATIQGAVDAAEANDVITVSAGVFYENVVIPIGLDGLTLQGKGADTVIDGRELGAAGSGDALAIDFCDGVIIRNLTIRNAQAGGTGAYSYGLGIDATGDGITIEKVTLLDNASYAILIDGDDARVLSCTVNSCDGGIEVDGDNALIKGCVVSNDTTSAIGIIGDGGTITKCRVNNISDSGVWVEGDSNTVTSNSVFNGGDYPMWSDGDNPTFTKNVIHGGVLDESGLHIESAVGGLIGGNKLTAVPGLAVSLSSDTSGMVIEKNQIQGGGLGYALVELGGDGHVFAGNTVSEGGSDGVVVTGNQIAISDNKVQRVMGTGLFLTSEATNTIVEANVLIECTLEGLRNSGLATHAVGNTLKDSRLDLTSNGSFAEFISNTYVTGGPGVSPEPEL